MSASSGHAGGEPSRWPALERWLSRLPSWLQPRDSDDLDPARGERSGGRRWRIETIVLVLLAATLAVAIVYDLTREVKVDDRLTADIETWRYITGIPDEEIAVEQDLTSYSTVDTACGDLVESKQKVSVRLCLMMDGPVVGKQREVMGGFYLPPYLPIGPNDRYGCFGSTVAEHFCTYATPLAMPSGAPKRFHARG